MQELTPLLVLFKRIPYSVHRRLLSYFYSLPARTVLLNWYTNSGVTKGQARNPFETKTLLPVVDPILSEKHNQKGEFLL